MALFSNPFIVENIRKKNVGALAQLVERLNGIEKVSGSRPLSSTFLVSSNSSPAIRCVAFSHDPNFGVYVKCLI